ncbi:uncharacterized protein N7496_007845 [Penicillium cataractarum]|uniref:HTH CENPB-type domain-containing protein n=1 Tax=Penicillium cataractarum TaxID=2100454 RepID=A0A9W9RYN0_9EURO|nr:uncharacterized protein N7496_007845 [Penicillium cataractarum]KAJ5368085.1 hypothetical protein N7496_007845 [Penicillium cataractarum]
MSDNTPQSARTTSRAGIPEDQKKALRAWCRSQGSRPTHAASVAWFQRTFGRRLPQSSVSVILSSKYEYLDTGPATGSFRQQPPQWPILEARLFEWLKRARETGELSTGDAIFNKAREIWPQITEYANRAPPAFSHGWLAKFRKRFEASLSKGQQDGVLPAPPRNQRKELQALRTLAGEFKEENVYNIDETGLLWRKAPFDTLPSGPNELKKDRAHICLMVCTNATGSDRIPLWVIGHKEMPGALRGVNLKAMDCQWRHNQQAWVDVQIMSEWLTMFYHHVGSRRVVLLLDDKPAHQAALETTPPPGNVHVQCFPEKSPNSYQPLRLGITQQLKTHYRKQWLGYMATSFDSGSSPMEMISLYHTLCWITRNWRHDVANATIYKAFRKSHLVEPRADYLTAPKPPDMTELYDKVIRYNQSGTSTRRLEEWLNPAEEDFAGTMDEALRQNPNVDTFILDESVNPLPPYELIPAPADAIAGIQTAIRYMLNQPTTTANDILYLETMEKILDRKVRNQFLQQQNQTPNQTPTQLSAEAAVQISAPPPAQPQIQSSTPTSVPQSSMPPSQPSAQPYSQPYRPPVRPATQAPLPAGQRPLPQLAQQPVQHALQTPTQQPVRTHMQYQFPNQNSNLSRNFASTRSPGQPSFRPSQAGIRPAGMAPIHIPSETPSAASTPGPSTGQLGYQARAPSEEGSYQPSEDQFSDDDMEI